MFDPFATIKTRVPDVAKAMMQQGRGSSGSPSAFQQLMAASPMFRFRDWLQGGMQGSLKDVFKRP